MNKILKHFLIFIFFTAVSGMLVSYWADEYWEDEYEEHDRGIFQDIVEKRTLERRPLNLPSGTSTVDQIFSVADANRNGIDDIYENIQ